MVVNWLKDLCINPVRALSVWWTRVFWRRIYWVVCMAVVRTLLSDDLRCSASPSLWRKPAFADVWYGWGPATVFVGWMTFVSWTDEYICGFRSCRRTAAPQKLWTRPTTLIIGSGCRCWCRPGQLLTRVADSVTQTFWSNWDVWFGQTIK